MNKINLTTALAARSESAHKPTQNETGLKPHLDKIATAIKNAEGRACERRIVPDDILAAIETAEKSWNLPKRLLTGITIDVDLNAQNFPRRYKWVARSTQFTAVCRNGRWFLTDIRRAPCRRYGHNIIAQLPDEALEYIANRAVRQARDIPV